MKLLSTKSGLLTLILIIILGALFRFYKLDWGNGLFSHPDEYHIVISVNQLSFPSQMNPHFFSYGTVTIYLIYFTQVFLDSLSSILNLKSLTFSPFLIGRFYSALFSTLTIPAVYFIGQQLFKKPFPILAAFLAALTPGLIQQAHFATPESEIIFFLSSCLLFSILFVQKGKILYLAIAAVMMGLSLGTKVSTLPFSATIFLAIVFGSWPSFIKGLQLTLASLVLVAMAFAASSPFVILDFSDFRNNLLYEGSLAAGQIPVFYTRQFIDTTPIIFQAGKIFPFALGPALAVLGSIGFFNFLYVTIKRRQPVYALVLAAFLAIFLPNSFLFAKWTRFISPTFPFFAIFTAFLFAEIFKLKIPKYILATFCCLFFILASVWSLAVFSIYLHPDVHISASKWLRDNTPAGSTFLVEGGNTVDLPLEGDFRRISLDFYNLYQDPLSREKIIQALQQSDYFIIESRRVFLNHQRLPQLFPVTARFYNNLFSGKAGFVQLKEFHSFPQITLPSGGKIEFPDENAEETWSVFDHPVIRVFAKRATLTKDSYEKLFTD